MRLAPPTFLAVLCITLGCTEKNVESDSATASSTAAAIPFTPAAGESFLAVPDGKIWYRVVGAGTATPAILLHGGPGFSSYYLKPYEEGLKSDRRIVRYDQLGAGHSDVITDTAMFNIAHFVNELDSLRAHL
ncbi:MAG: hypothetical protein M3Z17_11890, partial [Gemmatimonadota bacterium]|nr:hypothetical protein [Gemmatimonadota bacterium]